jgi:hypothetical protein
MNAMTMPGFSGEASLYEAERQYQRTTTPAYSARGNRIVPQLKSCGSCTPLTWPNGTNTGACAQACCDSRWTCTPGGGCRPETFCYTETCQCQGSGSVGGWGWVLAL